MSAGEFVIRAVLLLFGLSCIGAEEWGTYDFLMEKQGRFDYLVFGGLVLTGSAAVLPLGAEFARRNGMRGLKWTAWLAVPIALAFVFTVSIQRTGTATDTDEASRKQTTLAIKIAEKEEREAEAKRPKDQKVVDDNCGIWGPKCTQAKEDLRATERKLADARGALKKHGVTTDDSMARRIVAYLPFLTTEQVHLYQPMLLPMGLALCGALLIAITVRSGKHPERNLGLWARFRQSFARPAVALVQATPEPIPSSRQEAELRPALAPEPLAEKPDVRVQDHYCPESVCGLDSQNADLEP